MGFNVGDRVEVVLSYSSMYKEIGSITGGLIYMHDTQTMGYPTDIPHPCPNPNHVNRGYGSFRAEHLKLIYDGHETCSWEDCVWRPDVVTV